VAHNVKALQARLPESAKLIAVVKVRIAYPEFKYLLSP
jgi:hypothetical protein